MPRYIPTSKKLCAPAPLRQRKNKPPALTRISSHKDRDASFCFVAWRLWVKQQDLTDKALFPRRLEHLDKRPDVIAQNAMRRHQFFQFGDGRRQHCLPR